MDNSVIGGMDMLDSGYPRGVHGDVGHGLEPGLSATLPCRRLPIIPRYMFLLLLKKTHNHVAGEVLKDLPGIFVSPVSNQRTLALLASPVWRKPGSLSITYLLAVARGGLRWSKPSGRG